MNPELTLSTLPLALPGVLPFLLFAGALATWWARPFRVARGVTLATAVLAVGAGVLGASTGLEPTQRVMLALVGLIGFVITRYAEPYLEGDPRRPPFVRALLTTLGAVTVLVITPNLGVLWVAWMGSSLALHQLLTHRPDRPQALVAAHKKFLVSRLADVTIVTAACLLYVELGTLDIEALGTWARGATHVPLAVHLAMVSLVLGVALKSAQLPFHGWLTQVMEAPTPVSALLHAGVVNIGGFVLIRLAPVLERTPLAMALLVGIGLTTALVGAAVMSTQQSIKVKLAWSTCAQMGLMLVQCGLGAWSLALLHLVAHSAYKAHAFLIAGSTVDQWRIAAQAPTRERPSIGVALVALLGTGSLAWALGAPALSVLWVVAVAGHLSLGTGRGWWSSALVVAQAGALVGMTLVWHAVFSFGSTPEHATAGSISAALVAAGFVGLYLLQLGLARWPSSDLARGLRPHLYAGLYLDEGFTRLTFRIWPPSLPPRPAPIAPSTPIVQEA